MTLTPVPNLQISHRGPLHPVEEVVLNQIQAIEAWFREEWKLTPPTLTSSVDIRNSGYKIAPVDTNLFPAGFNNLSQEFLPLCILAAQSVLKGYNPGCTRILILPESHTRNPYYRQSLAVLYSIFSKAGFVVRIGSLDPTIQTVEEVTLDNGIKLLFEPLERQGDRVGLSNFNPCLLLLNNDLSDGVPEILQGLNQRIRPTAKLGWTSRLKSSHFNFYDEVATEFCQLIHLDPWFINPYFEAVEGVDFLAKEGLDELANKTDALLEKIKDKYVTYGIKEEPYVAVKADNGTYGMSVMMIHHGDELRNLNRKQRTKMSSIKGSRKVEKVIIQEGVYTFETMPDGAVAEPVVYMIGDYVVGGFYRVHQGRGVAENLNAPGMHFAPLAFSKPCNMPSETLNVQDCPNRFYVYGVVSRLAALAAAREIAAIGGE